MRVRFIWPGKTRDARLRALIEDFVDRVSHFVRCEVIEVREEPRPDKAGIDKESRRISDALRPGAITIALDSTGVQWTSVELAGQLRRWESEAAKELAFIVGGPRGLSRELVAQVDKKWSLSRLTLTHEMARLLVVEQLYRAYTINHNLPYQK